MVSGCSKRLCLAQGCLTYAEPAGRAVYGSRGEMLMEKEWLKMYL